MTNAQNLSFLMIQIKFRDKPQIRSTSNEYLSITKKPEKTQKQANKILSIALFFKQRILTFAPILAIC